MQVDTCSLCGASQDTAVKYYNSIRKQQAGSSADELGQYRVTLVAPRPLKGAVEDKPRISSDAPLSQGERQQAFMARRFNELTLRQRAAHRRRLWQVAFPWNMSNVKNLTNVAQRRAGPGGMEWVRVVMTSAGGGGRRGGGGGGGGGGGDDDREVLLSRDSFGDDAHLSHSPG